MRVWFSIIPGHGHFFPFLPLARALRDAGHEVGFCTSKSYGSTVEAHGFEAIEVGPDYTQSGVVGGTGEPGELEKLMFVDGPPKVAQALLDLVDESPPDALLTDPWDFGAMVAAEKAELHWGCVFNGILSQLMGGNLPFDLEERAGQMAQMRLWSRLREEFGLPPLDLLDTERPFDRSFVLSMAPPSLEPWPHEWRSHTTHQLRPEIHTSDSDDAWLESLPDDRPVVAVSLGTLFGTAELYDEVCEAVLATDATVVAATPFDLSVEDSRLHTTGWVSMDNLMRRSDVLVHHGGWGSMVAALSTGTPSVVVPLGADQFVNAARIERTGAGLTVDSTSLGSTGDAARKALDDPVYRLSAERLRSEIEAMPSAEQVVPLIERLAAEGPPIFNR